MLWWAFQVPLYQSQLYLLFNNTTRDHNVVVMTGNKLWQYLNRFNGNQNSHCNLEPQYVSVSLSPSAATPLNHAVVVSENSAASTDRKVIPQSGTQFCRRTRRNLMGAILLQCWAHQHAVTGCWLLVASSVAPGAPILHYTYLNVWQVIS